MATYAIGDVQGCYDQLTQLLDLINFDGDEDKLIFVGDLINRGPKSLETLRFIKSLGKSAKVILGNHDLYLLAVSYGYLPPSKKDTIQDILDAEDKSELIEWLCHQKLLIQQDDYTITHAGLPPIWSTKKARKRAKELEFVLKTPVTRKLFLSNLFGDQPNLWDKSLEGINRWRCIANYLTRMRVCDDEGRLNFSYKASLDKVKDEWSAWFNIKNKSLKKNEKIIFGHWAALCGKTGKSQFIAIDTGCVWGNTLSAYCLESKQRFQVPASDLMHKICHNGHNIPDLDEIL